MAVGEGLGRKVRTVRESRKLSQQEMAERAALPAELVAKIEGDELVPSLSLLLRIARVLGVRLGTFLDDQENVGAVVTRSGELPRVTRFSSRIHAGPSSDLDFHSLAVNKSGRHMEPFLIDIHPSSAESVQPSSHEGEEFIHVFEGEVEVLYGKDTYRLGVGDSIYYDSVVSHHVHCSGGDTARILAVVYAPL